MTMARPMLLVASALILSGCIAYKPPKHVATDKDELVPFSIAVERGTASDYGYRSFVRSLEMLEGVSLLDDEVSSQGGHTVRNLEYAWDGRCFSEPMLTTLTLGIIPSVGCTQYGYEFELGGGQFAEPELVNTADDVPSVWGWAALFLLPSKDWVGERGFSEYKARRLGEAINRTIQENQN